MLEHFEPKEVFQYFEEICAIPHGSGNCQQISDYLVEFAKAHALSYRQDDCGNVIIWKKASAGYEGAAPVILQGHMDMVCEKEAGCAIDFETDGLKLCVDGPIISAEGTTLGGDDGIAVAYCLALLAADDIAHPPLECVFTVDEEVGMLGAQALSCSDLKGRLFLNLDSEEEGEFLLSCAGGVSVLMDIPVKYEKTQGRKYRVSVSGLQGGHSGTEIHRGGANANKLLGDYFHKLNSPFSLVEICGGQKDNAIPREAHAVFAADCEEAVLRRIFHEVVAQAREKYAANEPDMKWEFVREDEVCQAMTKEDSANVIRALVALPNGVVKMSGDIDGLVQTSLNLGILAAKEESVSFTLAVRSSVEREKQELVAKIRELASQCGGRITTAGEYPAWEYKEDSWLRHVIGIAYEEQYGKKPIWKAIHAGLECGLFAGKLPGLDCVSFGPDMKDIHTTKECMDAHSVQRTWKLLLTTLSRLK